MLKWLKKTRVLTPRTQSAKSTKRTLCRKTGHNFMPETQKRQAHYRCQHYRQPYLNVRHQKFWQMLLVRKFKVVTMSTKEKNFTSPHCEPMAQTQQSDTMHIKPNSCRQRQLILHIYMAQYTRRNRIASQVSYLKKAVHHTVKQLTAGVDGDVQWIMADSSNTVRRMLSWVGHMDDVSWKRLQLHLSGKSCYDDNHIKCTCQESLVLQLWC